MTFTKAVVRSILIAGLAVSSAEASSMLVLGVNSNSGSSPSTLVSPSVFNSAYFQAAQAAPLTLGVMSSAGSVPYSGSNTAFTPAVSAPIPAQAAPVVTQPVSTPSYSTQAAAAPATYDAYINLGNGPYPNASSLTSGNPQAWYMSAPVDKLFGGVPNAQQQSAFDSIVLQRVQQTFSQSGVPITLTTNANDSAAHTLSVVSQTTNPTLSNAIGMTYLGGNGFHFIDNSASAAQTVDQLEWIVAHNISHELMLAFNVPENYDKTGNYIDARNASWSMMTNPNATFSPDAVNALLAQNFLNTNSTVLSQGAQLLGAETVPEPTTVALWVGLASVGILVQNRRRGLARHA